MTTTPDLYLHPAEKDPLKVNNVVRQLIERRVNASYVSSIGTLTGTVAIGNGLTTSGGALVTSGIGFFAHKNGSDQTSLTHNAYNTITWPTEKFDAGGYFDTTNNKWTPPAGYVQINCHVWVRSGFSTSAGNPVVKIFKNGVTDVAAGVGTPVSGISNAGQGIAHVSCVDSCNGVDYYQAEIFYYSGAATNDGVVDGNMAHTHFSGHWIGA